MAWQREAPHDTQALRALAAEVRAAFPNLASSRDLEWTAVEHGWPGKELVILVEREGGRIVGFAALPVGDAVIDAPIAGFTPFRFAVRQVRIIEDIAVCETRGAAARDDCLALLSTLMRPQDVVLVSAVAVGGTLHERLTNGAGRWFRALRWGPTKINCQIQWTGNYESYLASLGKVSRKDMRRAARALFGDASLKSEVRTFRTPAEAEVFLRDGMRVSDKTYQRKDLGLGIFAGGNAERAIRFAASVDGLRACILYVNGAPVAFEYGFVWGGICVMKQAGYDPAWAAHQVGAVLFGEFIRGCEQDPRPIRSFDLMPGLSVFKLRTSNERLPVQHFLLFSRSFVGAARFAALGGAMAIAAIGRRVLGRESDDEIAKYKGAHSGKMKAR